MYRVNVSLFIKTEDYPLIDQFLRSRLVPQMRDDEGIAQVELLEVMPQLPSADQQPLAEEMVLALLISLDCQCDLESYLSGILCERLSLLGETFGERVLYHMTPMRQVEL